MKISLLGYMGVGKTTIGRELAEKLKIEFLDLDFLIEQKYQTSISQIFEIKKEIGFRKMEREVLMETLKMNQSFVLALGGGTPAYYNNIQEIIQHTTSFYLRMSPSGLIKRLEIEDTIRPLISHVSKEDRLEFVAKHLFDRRSYYDQAKFTIDVLDKSLVEIADEIIRHLLL